MNIRTHTHPRTHTHTHNPYAHLHVITLTHTSTRTRAHKLQTHVPIADTLGTHIDVPTTHTLTHTRPRVRYTHIRVHTRTTELPPLSTTSRERELGNRRSPRYPWFQRNGPSTGTPLKVTGQRDQVWNRRGEGVRDMCGNNSHYHYHRELEVDTETGPHKRKQPTGTRWGVSRYHRDWTRISTER